MTKDHAAPDQTLAPLWQDRLIAAAAAGPDRTALRHKGRGLWLDWSWRDVVAETDRLASALRALGVGPDAGLAISGEIGPNVLLLALAARIVGAAIIPVSHAAKAAALRAILARQSVGAAVVQGRDTLALWLDAIGKAGAPTRILFDHSTPDGGFPHPAVLTLEAARHLVAPQGWAEGLRPPARRPAPVRSAWVEETSDWPDAFEVLLDAWLAGGMALVFPELMAAASRDRREIQPQRWIASPQRIAIVASEIESRLPQRQALTGRIVARVLEARSNDLSARLVRGLLRRHLGLAALGGIDVARHRGLREIAADERPDTRRLFAALGVPLNGLAYEGTAQQRGREPPRRGDLVLVGGSQ